jgi:hypothetical protein
MMKRKFDQDGRAARRERNLGSTRMGSLLNHIPARALGAAVSFDGRRVRQIKKIINRYGNFSARRQTGP